MNKRSIEARTDLCRRGVGCEEECRIGRKMCDAAQEAESGQSLGGRSRLLRRGCSGQLRMMMGEEKRGAVR